MYRPIICALDTRERNQAKQWAKDLAPHIGIIKLGLEFFCAEGPQGVKAVAEEGVPIFLDLKLHDIPNTVRGAVRSLAPLPIAMLTVHASGGKAMLRAAREAMDERQEAKKPLLLGISVLTSLETQDLHDIGVASSVEAQVQRLADLAMETGIDGLVCSPHEVALLRRQVASDFVLVTPGVRPKGSALGDQKRVMTPEEALQTGANYVVIGRPITEQADPVAAAKALAACCAL